MPYAMYTFLLPTHMPLAVVHSRVFELLPYGPPPAVCMGESYARPHDLQSIANCFDIWQ